MVRNFNWKTFEEAGKNFSETPLISIRKSGGLAFNTAFMRKYYEKNNPSYCVFHYDNDEDYHYIGLTFTDDKNTPGKLKVNYLKQHYGQASSISFFKKYNINFKTLETTRYKPEMIRDDEIGKMFVITLRK